MAKNSQGFVHGWLVRRSALLTGLLVVLAGIGAYLGTKVELRLSLTDLLPDNHPAVLKLNELTEVVGGVGYFSVILRAEDGESHLKAAPVLIEEFKKNPLVRSAFYHREQRFFIDRVLYYLDLAKLQDLEKNITRTIRKARISVVDLGLWDDEPKEEKNNKPVFENEVKDMAKKSNAVSPYLISKDKKHLLIMIKPSFDSTDLDKTESLVGFSENLLKDKLPAGVTYEFAERYYSKIIETRMIKTDIILLGTLSILLIAGIIFLYLRSFRGMMLIFIPVFMGMGLTIGLTYLLIGHINIVTGFLMGIVSGLGVDYGIHLLLRLKGEIEEPGNDDPVWRTIVSSGHSVFVGAVSAAFAFYVMCFSSFKAFSEFGFICGTGILAVLACLLCSFSFLARFLKLDKPETGKAKKVSKWELPLIPIPKGLAIAGVISLVLCGLGATVGFEYDFNKMLQHSKKMDDLTQLVNTIYERSAVPSAFAALHREDAVAVEKLMKEKYVPKLVSEIVSGATIVPEHQAEKYQILQKIKADIAPLKDKWITKELDTPADVVRSWVDAKPFTFTDIPSHLQDALHGTRNQGYLMYFYPAISLDNAPNVNAFAQMVREIEVQFPRLLTGSDAVVFSDILHLINRDGFRILIAIFLSVGVFIWINVRKWEDTLLSYLPLLISLPVGMGLMKLFGAKFNIFNIAIIPTFVAMGIDVPIHMVHRTREIGSGYKAARDLAASVNLALITAGAGFGVLIFARAGVLKSLGIIALLGTVAIWWIGMFVLPAVLELLGIRQTHGDGEADKEKSFSGANTPAQ